jgi:hypothetical protein
MTDKEIYERAMKVRQAIAKEKENRRKEKWLRKENSKKGSVTKPYGGGKCSPK